jgi:hypothetical protein
MKRKANTNGEGTTLVVPTKRLASKGFSRRETISKL